MFNTSADLATALREAAAAHHEFEKTLGHPDADWASWYADYIFGKNLAANFAAKIYSNHHRVAGAPKALSLYNNHRAGA